MDDCTCYAPDDAEPEDHDNDCPENPGWSEDLRVEPYDDEEN
ncbi:hypothetical protein [Streptosporangium sp. G12]